MSRYFYTVALCIICFVSAGAQDVEAQKAERFVQVSGIITDELFRPVQGVAVVSKKFRRGIISEKSGIYSIASTPGDTIYYRALGYKRYHTIIPPSYSSKHCMVDIILEADTIPIEEVTILPWKTYGEFIRDMTKEQPVDPLEENMNENLASIYVAITSDANISVTPEAGFRYSQEQHFSSMATRGQYPVNNLLNPLAWSKFINSLKNGLLRNNPSKRPQAAKVVKKRKRNTKE